MTAISWPFGVAALLATLAVLADIVDTAGLFSLGDRSGWLAILAQSPAKVFLLNVLVVCTWGAFKMAGDGTEARRKLVAIRGSDLRRHRELSPDA